MRERLILAIVALAAFGVTAIVAYGDRVAAGVQVAGVGLCGMTGAEARAALGVATRDADVTLVAPVLSIIIDAASGLDVDVDRTIGKALEVGRRGDLWSRAADVAGAILFGRDIALVRRVTDAERLERTIELVAATVERDVADADVVVEGTDVVLRHAVTGVRLDRAATIDALTGATAIRATAALPLRRLAPSLDDDAAAAAFDAARNAALPLIVVAGSERIAVEPTRLLALVRVERDAGADGDRLMTAVDAAGVERLAAEIADALDGPAVEAALVPGDARLAVVAGRDAVTVDRVAARAFLLGAITGSDRTVDVPATIAHPALTTVSAQRIADTTELVGGYTTYFPINWARATNIGAAARTFDNMTVAPGASFSFWERLGEVSTRTGYVSAGTIIDGVSSEAIGGGLCQVSTTFFNAVAAAGYAIDERHPHSYYIERYPLGLDAAVFAPSTDMRWTNDTPATANVRASSTDTSVSFWIYSPPTGRTTTFGKPVQWNVVWPSASQPADPGHVPGYVVPGRDTAVTRTVVAADGGAVHEDTWYSHYAPVWGGPAR